MTQGVLRVVAGVCLLGGVAGVTGGCAAPADDDGASSSDVAALQTDQEIADAAGALLARPDDLVTDAYESIWFLKTGSTKIDLEPLSEEDGRRLYLHGMLPNVADATAFKAAAHHKAFPSWAANAPCAYSVSELLEVDAKLVGFDGVAERFQNHDGLALTHAVEIQMRDLGFTYYSKETYLAPRGAIGMWDRYTLGGWKQHSGHIYSILKDEGASGRDDRIADNGTRFDHVYTPEGHSVGFWLPPGVYPKKRAAAPTPNE